MARAFYTLCLTVRTACLIVTKVSEAEIRRPKYTRAAVAVALLLLLGILLLLAVVAIPSSKPSTDDQLATRAVPSADPSANNTIIREQEPDATPKWLVRDESLANIETLLRHATGFGGQVVCPVFVPDGVRGYSERAADSPIGGSSELVVEGGTIRLVVEGPTGAVIAKLDGYSPIRISWSAAPDGGVGACIAEVPSMGAATLTGIVRDQRGQVVDGADVYGCGNHTFTDNFGAYSFEPKPGTCDLFVAKYTSDTAVTSEHMVVTVSEGENIVDIVFQVASAASIEIENTQASRCTLTAEDWKLERFPGPFAGHADRTISVAPTPTESFSIDDWAALATRLCADHP